MSNTRISRRLFGYHNILRSLSVVSRRDQIKHTEFLNLLPALISVLTLVVLGSGCATSHKPPVPGGPSQPINSAATIEMLSREARLSEERLLNRLVSPNGAAPANISTDRSSLLFQRQAATSAPQSSGAGKELDRTGTVVIEFPFASTEFAPSPAQAQRIKALIPHAERIEVRGRSDGYGGRTNDSLTAHRRAEAAKRYLLEYGAPSSGLSVNYQPAGDYVADNYRHEGRQRNRRVEIEFYLRNDAPHFPALANVNESRTQPQVRNEQWQAVTTRMKFPAYDEWQAITRQGEQ